MKNLRIFLVLSLCFSVASILSAQHLQTGFIKGIVTDTEGVPLPGVAITVTGPNLIGSRTAITTESGTFRVPALPPGTYTLETGLEGFQTVKREGVIVNVGVVVRISIEMAPSPVEEEITVIAASPVVDIQSTKVVTIMTKELMENLPLNRSLSDIMESTPGTVGSVMHGGTEISNAYEIDGVNVNDPCMNGRFLTIQYDAMEEVEMITGGIPAQVGNTSGSFVNVVTKSGGNEFHGNLQLYYTNEDLSEILFPEHQLTALGVGKPEAAISDVDTSGTFGGPIMKDKLWFFSTLAYYKSKYHSNFIPTTISGKSYDQYPNERREYSGMLKLTTQISDSLRLFIMGHFRDYLNPYYSWGDPRTTVDSTQVYKIKQWTGTANLTWLLGTETFLDLRAAISDRKWPILYHEGTENEKHYYDAYTWYDWGSTFRFGEHVWRNIRQASARLTHFQDDFLGGDHEIRAGVEWQWGVDEWAWYRPDPIHWDWYNGSPYYYRGLYGTTEPVPGLGDGRISISMCGATQEDSYANGSGYRIGVFLQDSWTIKGRLTLNIGVRFDTYNGYMPATVKKASAGIAEAIGAATMEPLFDINPYGELQFNEWKDVMSWNPISPRIGITYDLFGDGKTALKASFSQYSEALPVMYFQTVHPHRPRSFSFNWWDDNNNQQLDAPGIDTYEHYGTWPTSLFEDYYKKRIDEDIKAPMFDEFTASIQHELFQDFNVSLQYIWRQKRDTVDTVMWDPDADKYWYTYEQAPEYWIPFTTIVPEHGDFPEEEVTLYFMSNNAPGWFSQFDNVPEAKRKYQAVEFMFNKRMSNGWQLGGSIVYSVTKGNNSGSYGSVWGYGGAYDHANWWVNRYGHMPFDRPLNIKIFGTFALPLRFLASFLLNYNTGSPWGREITVYAPADWLAANNCNSWFAGYWYTRVYVELPGSRRNVHYSNLDFRLEKEFVLPYGKIGVFVDVFNLLGRTELRVGQNPGGDWFPVAENTNVGTYTPSYWYGKVDRAIGSRTWKLSIRYTF